MHHKNFALLILCFWIIVVTLFFKEVSAYAVTYNLSLFEALGYIDLTIQRRLAEYGILSSLLFIFVYTLRPLVFFPASIMTITSVFIFGPIHGFIISYLGEISSAILTFFVGKYFAEELGITRRGFITRIAPYFRENAFLSVFILRIVPIFPFDFVNYASGVFKINFKKYIYATILGVAPGLIVFIFLAYSIVHRELLPWAIAATVITIATGIWMKKRYEIPTTDNKIKSVTL